MKITWNEYLDKISGCWLGRILGGAAGSPYSGYKGAINIDKFAPITNYSDRGVDIMLLWLDVIKHKGSNYTQHDLAEKFYNDFNNSTAESGVLCKNFELGIEPPLSGIYNNKYYCRNTGSITRTQFWACMAFGNPELAASLAYDDARIDHNGESVVASCYLTALEALAFTSKKDIRTLIIKSMEYISEQSVTYILISQVLSWCENYSFDSICGLIRRTYGNYDYSDVLQNLAYIITSLLLGKGDYEKTIIMAASCGFDSGCNCGYCGALCGILLGSNKMLSMDCIKEQRYTSDLENGRDSNHIFDLAIDVANAGLLFLDVNKKVEIIEVIEENVILPEDEPEYPLTFKVDYGKRPPVIKPGESVELRIVLESDLKFKVGGVIKFTAPEGIMVKPTEKKFHINFSHTEFTIKVTAPIEATFLMNKNVIGVNITLRDGNTIQKKFGIAGATIYKAYGPFWDFTEEISQPKLGDMYRNNFKEDSKLRLFMLNAKVGIEKEYMEAQLLGKKFLPLKYQDSPEYLGFPICLNEDRFSINDVVKYKGPCVIYLVREIFCPTEMEVCLQIGYSDAFRIWQEGKLIASSDNVNCYTPEDIIKPEIKIKKGLNRFVIKLCRRAMTSDFSMIFTKNGRNSDMITCFGGVSFYGKDVDK